MERRKFFEYLLGASALSVLSINKLNASIYENIESLNSKYLQDDSPDGPYWNSIRKHFAFTDDLIMMNNGTLGAMPKPVFNTLMKYFKVQTTNPYDCYNFFPQIKGEVKNKLAKFVNAGVDEVAITRNTTEGMNLVPSGIDFKKGDEIIMSTQEHPGGYNPIRLAEKRYDLKIIEVPLGVPPKSVDEIINDFKNAITSKTKVIMVSHTNFITGLIFPTKELSEITRKKNIILVVDSAHGIGMLNLDMKKLGIDVFASSAYKWLGTPTGCGLLYVRKEVQDRIWPNIASGGWDGEGCSRFETLGQRADPLIFAFGEAMDFHNKIGRGRIERRIRTMSDHLKKELKKIPGVRIHTSDDPYLSAGLTAFSIEGVKPQTIVDYVREKYNIVIRTIGRDRDKTSGVRVSTNIFVSLKQVNLLLEGINYLARKRG